MLPLPRRYFDSGLQKRPGFSKSGERDELKYFLPYLKAGGMLPKNYAQDPGAPPYPYCYGRQRGQGFKITPAGFPRGSVRVDAGLIGPGPVCVFF